MISKTEYNNIKTGDVILTDNGLRVVAGLVPSYPYKSCIDPTHQFTYTIHRKKIKKIIDNVCKECLVKVTCNKDPNIHHCFMQKYQSIIS